MSIKRKLYLCDLKAPALCDDKRIPGNSDLSPCMASKEKTVSCPYRAEIDIVMNVPGDQTEAPKE